MSDIASMCVGNKAGENNVLDNMVIFGDKEGNELFSRKDPELSKVLREHVLPNLQEYWQKDLKAKVDELEAENKRLKKRYVPQIGMDMKGSNSGPFKVDATRNPEYGNKGLGYYALCKNINLDKKGYL